MVPSLPEKVADRGKEQKEEEGEKAKEHPERGIQKEIFRQHDDHAAFSWVEAPVPLRKEKLVKEGEILCKITEHESSDGEGEKEKQEAEQGEGAAQVPDRPLRLEKD